MRYLDKFLIHARTGRRQQSGLSHQDFQTLPQEVGTENCCLTGSTRNVCKNVSSWPTGLFSSFYWNHFSLFTTSLPPIRKLFSAYGSLPPAAPFTQLCLQSLLSDTLCSRLEWFSTANNLSNLWCSKLQHVGTYAFCRWDDKFTLKWNWSSPNNLRESTKSPSPLSSNSSIVWSFYLSWSNHLVVPYVLEMNAGHLSKHQNKASETNRYKRFFFHQKCLSDQCVYYEENFWTEV